MEGNRDRDVDLTWVEKYVTYQQNADNSLTVTDFHFLSEVCYEESWQLDNVEATLFVEGGNKPLATYTADDPRAFSNGSFYTRKSKSHDDLAALDRAHPPDNAYVWEISGPAGRRRLAPIRIGGPQGVNQIPDAGPITLAQQGVAITDYADVRVDLPLVIGWPPFTIGASHPGTIWDDLIFVLISDAGGGIVFTGGAPNLASGFLDYTKTSVEAPAGIMQPGTEYVVFISQVKYVDNNVSDGIEQVACNSFAVELPVRTAGAARPFTGRRRKAPYLWGGKTPADQGLVPWPAFFRD